MFGKSNDFVQSQKSSALHECHVVTDHVLKHVEDNIPLSDSDVTFTEVFPISSSQIEVPLIHIVSSEGLIVTEVSKTLSRGIMTSALFVVDIFLEKLFGVGSGRFQATTTEDNIVTVNLLNL